MVLERMDMFFCDVMIVAVLQNIRFFFSIFTILFVPLSHVSNLDSWLSYKNRFMNLFSDIAGKTI